MTTCVHFSVVTLEIDGESEKRVRSSRWLLSPCGFAFAATTTVQPTSVVAFGVEFNV